MMDADLETRLREVAEAAAALAEQCVMEPDDEVAQVPRAALERLEERIVHLDEILQS